MTPILLVWAVLVSPAMGQETNRILRAFDFEERKLGNFEDLPMHWVKIEGPGLPHYVSGQLATDRARSGRFSFRLDLNGGSAIYRYPAGMIPVRPGGHYRVEAYVQATTMRHARARLTAFLTDIDHRPIAGAVRHTLSAGLDESGVERRSGPHPNPLPEGEGAERRWEKLTVDLSADSDAAAFLVLEVGLLQPELYAATALGSRALFAQEIRGSAWFDDITVSQVPRVRLSSDAAGNLFGFGQPVQLRAQVSDRSTADLIGRLSVRSADGREFHQQTQSLGRSVAADASPGQKQITLSMPPLPPGWYEARLEIHSHAQPVGEEVLRFAVLGEDRGQSRDQAAAADAPPVAAASSRRTAAGSRRYGVAAAAPAGGRFGVVATHLPVELWADLPEVLERLGAGRVKLPIWTSTLDVADHPAEFDRLLDALRERRIAVTGCLVDLPPGVQQRLRQSPLQEPAGWADLAAADPEIWQPRLAFLVSRYAGYIDQWQLGGDGAEAFAVDATMDEVFRLVFASIGRLAQRPELTVPWPAWHALPAAPTVSGESSVVSGSARGGASLTTHHSPLTIQPSQRRLAISVPASVQPAQLPLYLEQWPAGSPAVDLVLEPLDAAQYGREAQARDLAKRMILAVAGGAERIDVPLPLRLREASGRMLIEPDELLLVVRTVLATLNGARFVGPVPLGDDIEAFLFDRQGEGVLAIWHRGEEEALRHLALNPGPKAERIDIRGRAAPLLAGLWSAEARQWMMREEAAGGSAANQAMSVDLPVAVGPAPIFLVGIDAHVAQLRASLELDRPLIESSFRPHVRRVRFVNPYPQAIAGTLRLRPPPGWTINPPALTFTLNPGERFDGEITIAFPYNSFAGAKILQAQLELGGSVRGAPPQITLPLAVNLGLADVAMQTIATRDGRDLVVQQIISNYGDAPIDYTAFAVFPGHARQERLVTNLAPGRSTVRIYRFPDVDLPPGATVRSGLRELRGTRILNDEVGVE